MCTQRDRRNRDLETSEMEKGSEIMGEMSGWKKLIVE